ncbi:MAG: HRDC domain-containing protein, partial [Oscillospiraceae bacterium]|nr:HRDC domain-containing protein [Oscillospiraceae bacterium]
MAFNQQLYNDLYCLRQRIKDCEKRRYGRAPSVCSDSSLYEIAKLCPKKLTDFESVPGIGRTFIDNYGKKFLDVILKHTEVQNEKKVDLSSSAADTLKELEKKLVSINRRNRLLYMPKLSNKYAFDMFEVGKQKLDGLLYGKEPSITLAKMGNYSDGDSLKAAMRFKRIAQLLREVNKDLRDKGQNDLYVGYPYVIGRIPGENFDIRAPLALFPVTAEKTATEIKISLDESRDVIFNNTLVLAYFKFNNITKPLPADVIENVGEHSLWSTVIDFYSENEIHIKDNKTEFLKFREYKSEEFPRYNNGELYSENCAILGKFPICSNSI